MWTLSHQPPVNPRRERRKLVCEGARVCLQGGFRGPGTPAARLGRPVAPAPVPPAYLALAEAAAARPGWKAAATPDRTRPECSRAMVVGRRAVGGWRTERRCQRARTQRREVLLKVRAATSPGEARAASRRAPSRVTAHPGGRSGTARFLCSLGWRVPGWRHVVPENSDSTVYRSLQRSTHFFHLTTTDPTGGVAAIMPL